MPVDSPVDVPEISSLNHDDASAAGRPSGEAAAGGEAENFSVEEPNPAASQTPARTEALVLHEVPFISQAPFGDWDDPRQQDGCEEAASLMAVAWARGEELTARKALELIIALADYQEKEFSGFHDTSAADTAERIIRGYFKHDQAEVMPAASPDDIVGALQGGSLVIAPMDGQALGNPYYTAPGPERHMLLVVGYDPETGEFITNDNGTRRGQGYRYGKSHFFRAVRDYPTGNHEPIVRMEKNIIIVSRAP